MPIRLAGSPRKSPLMPLSLLEAKIIEIVTIDMKGATGGIARRTHIARKRQQRMYLERRVQYAPGTSLNRSSNSRVTTFHQRVVGNEKRTRWSPCSATEWGRREDAAVFQQLDDGSASSNFAKSRWNDHLYILIFPGNGPLVTHSRGWPARLDGMARQGSPYDARDAVSYPPELSLLRHRQPGLRYLQRIDYQLRQRPRHSPGHESVDVRAGSLTWIGFARNVP